MKIEKIEGFGEKLSKWRFLCELVFLFHVCDAFDCL